MQVAADLIELEVGGEHFREAIFAIRRSRRWGMHRKRGFIQVALELETGLFYEGVVVRVELDGRDLNIGPAERTCIDIKVGLSFRQEANRLRRSGFTEENGKAYCHGNGQH